MGEPRPRLYGFLKDKRHPEEYKLVYLTRVIEGIKARWGPELVTNFPQCCCHLVRKTPTDGTIESRTYLLTSYQSPKRMNWPGTSCRAFAA
jgi:hypothetical protein